MVDHSDPESLGEPGHVLDRGGGRHAGEGADASGDVLGVVVVSDGWELAGLVLRGRGDVSEQPSGLGVERDNTLSSRVRALDVFLKVTGPTSAGAVRTEQNACGNLNSALAAWASV